MKIQLHTRNLFFFKNRHLSGFRKSLCFSLLFTVIAVKANSQELLSVASPKYQVAHQVFDRLTYAFADTRPQPRLEIVARSSKKNKVIAQYRPGSQPVIQLDEEVYDLCRKLQQDSLNALAVLLSHELAHHYKNHDWYFTFGIANNTTSKESIRQFESAADFYGCFYGELSGFATARVFPRVLDLIYQHFNLANHLEGYPTKEERKAIYAEKQKEAIKMVAVFKSGLFLYLIQEFGPAAQCFDYLANQFPSREIINNLAAAKLQLALQIYNKQEQPGFVYPVELDANSRLASARRDMPDAYNNKQLEDLLTDARRNAEKSREIDPSYVPAYINLACIYSLQGNQPAAIGIINELKPATITGNAHAVRAIAYYKDNQLVKAKKDFELAQQKGAYKAQYNLELFGRMNESLAGSLTTWIMSWFQEEAALHTTRSGMKEKIGNQPISAPLPAQTPRVAVNKNPALVIQWSEQNDYLQLGIQNANRHYLVHLTQENYNHPTARKIKRGTSLENLKNKYGDPAYSFSGATGDYLVYPENKIAFLLDKSKRVNSWLVYGRTL
ncbi:hypothetical protein HUW51_24150 [Adhaeribacter swui]|uniref:M48 family metalloprotease n=1 Tax=Adhaeribacter swui TaxID=2086471 RepID=A0A7G7GER5_9BACT|nr:hypothetical protein [Adhaeribacter swui]QNF35649.1 hypothetical protein HUW51_24150 [Adhaeribacter swui]